MNENRRELAHRILDMRLSGMSYQNIADKLGCTRQNVEQILKMREPTRRKLGIECVYPGLKKIINKEFSSLHAFTLFVYKDGSKEHPCTGMARKKLNGISSFTIPEITRLIELSGKPFEYLFLMTTEEVEEYDRNIEESV